MGSRFADDGRTIYDFGGRFLVRCPRCSHRAEVFAPQGYIDFHSPRRVSCFACGYTRRWMGDETAWRSFDDYYRNGSHGAISVGGPFDWYFGLPV
jgi:ribosomal protein S27E